VAWEAWQAEALHPPSGLSQVHTAGFIFLRGKKVMKFPVKYKKQCIFRVHKANQNCHFDHGLKDLWFLKGVRRKKKRKARH
jgi:hypothetical protein